MLYFVATPIGNLKDITYRAVETLNAVDVIACEDTRHSLTLLNHYGIKKPLISYHKFNEKESAEKIVEILSEGKDVAVISDAGMPFISDPGGVLVDVLKEKNLPFTVVPGASAFTSALLLSGFTGEFCFIGFLPEREKDKKELLSRYKNFPATLIFYTAPHDIKRDIETIYKVLGDRKASAVKEITKIHESEETFNLSEGLSGEIKGEYVLLVEGAKEIENPLNNLSVEEHIKHYIEKGCDKKEALKMTAKDMGVSKSSIYQYTVEK